MISIYVIQIILILLFGFLFRNDKKRFLIAAFIVLFVVMAFRDAKLIGVDSATSYYDEFSRIRDIDIEWPNPGLPIVMKIIRHFTDDYQWIIVITALVVCFAYYKLLVKHSENGFISVIWFLGMLFYTFLFSALKQAWAMSFLCFAFDAIIEKKPIRYFLFVSLAVIFHFPALVFLPAYWIAKLKINKAFPVLMFSILVVVFIFRTQILGLMTSTYAKGEVDYTISFEYSGTKFVFMILMLAYGFYQYFVNNYSSELKGKKFSTLIYFMGIAAVIQTFCLYSNNFERLADFYYQFSILFVPLILSKNDLIINDSENLDQLELNSIPSSRVALSKEKIRNYSINDIDINTVLTVIITVFCVWRFIYIVMNDTFFSPFFFFWQ